MARRTLASLPRIVGKCTLIDRPFRGALAGLPVRGFGTQKVRGYSAGVNATFWQIKRILAEIIFPRERKVISAYV